MPIWGKVNKTVADASFRGTGPCRRESLDGWAIHPSKDRPFFAPACAWSGAASPLAQEEEERRRRQQDLAGDEERWEMGTKL